MNTKAEVIESGGKGFAASPQAGSIGMRLAPVLQRSGAFGRRLESALRDNAEPVGQAVLRALWLVVIPGLLAGLTLRYLVPGAIVSGASAFENSLALWHLEDPVTSAVCVFLIFAVLARYWRFYLPGGRFFAKVAPRSSARAKREDLADLGAAAELSASLAKPSTRRRLEDRLARKSLAELDAQLERMAAAVETANGARARELRRSISELVSPALRLQKAAEGALFVGGVGALLLLALFLRTHLFQSYRVLSESMLPTLQPGDHIGGNKLAYGVTLPWSKERLYPHSPARGDVVVFRMSVGGGTPQDIAKRVIGLPGDHLTMHAGRPVINGWRVPNCHAGTYFHVSPSGKSVSGRLAVEFLGDKSYLTVYTPSYAAFDSYQVKPGEVFVVGDNRNLSKDSRSWSQVGVGISIDGLFARAEHLVIHANRGGEFDFRTFFQPLSGLNLNLDGVDSSQLEKTIKDCLAKRPAETDPPRKSAPTASAGAQP